MVSRRKAELIISLQKKKIREEERLYVIEGDKMVREYLDSGNKVRILVAVPEFLNSLPMISRQGAVEIIQAGFEELKKISSLKTPHNALAVIEMPDIQPDPEILKTRLNLVLECIQDPGNLGTIIRAAAWFGIKNIFCSEDSVDVYNPKVIQASMGAIQHVNVFYTGLTGILETARENRIKIYGTFLEGESIYCRKLDDTGIIILGNESKGISEELQPYITDRIMIPKTDTAGSGIDSLNVSMAASIILSEFTRCRGRMG